jgi:hypothetical protein
LRGRRVCRCLMSIGCSRYPRQAYRHNFFQVIGESTQVARLPP